MQNNQYKLQHRKYLSILLGKIKTNILFKLSTKEENEKNNSYWFIDIEIHLNLQNNTEILQNRIFEISQPSSKENTSGDRINHISKDNQKETTNIFTKER